MLTIGLDIGGTKISGVVFNGKTVLKNITIGTPKSVSGFKVVVKKVIEYLSQDFKISAIGVGIPGKANNSGKILYAPNVKYLENQNFLEFLKFTGIKNIKIDNDANCFALAEACLGMGKRKKNFIAITLGTGIGGGLISNGQIYAGIHGSAGEVGHLMANEKNTYEQLFQSYRDNKNYKALGELLGRLIADIYNLLDIEAVILGGSVVKSSDKFIKIALKEAKKRILNKQIKPALILSKLNNAGSIGAALLFKKK